MIENLLKTVKKVYYRVKVKFSPEKDRLNAKVVEP